MSIMSDMAKNDAYYKGKKLVGCVFDPTGFKKPAAPPPLSHEHVGAKWSAVDSGRTS
jgi:hypothetical protein